MIVDVGSRRQERMMALLQIHIADVSDYEVFTTKS
jgi:hypothetical protein